MKHLTLVFLFNCLIQFQYFSQGCSDAGICTINSHQTDSTADRKNSLELTALFGVGLEDVFYNSFLVSYSHEFSKKWSLSSRLNYNHATGSLGSIGGFGDLSIIQQYKQKISENEIIKVSFGAKIPLNSSNLKINDIALPMDYQSSLGTFDGLLAFEYSYKKWSLDAAIQQPFIQINQNQYVYDSLISKNFPNTNQFRRKSDVLLRASYSYWTKNEKLLIKPNIMSIYHLGNDTFENVSGERIEILDSRGLTVNINLLTEYYFNKKHAIRFNLATPLLVREIRPDGLTRSFVSSLSYIIKF